MDDIYQRQKRRAVAVYNRFTIGPMVYRKKIDIEWRLLCLILSGMSTTASVRDQVLYIISPTFFSGLVASAVSFALVLYVLVPFLYAGSYFEQYINIARNSETSVSSAYSSLSTQLNSSEIVADIVIFSVWAAVGLTIYYTVLALLSLVINLSRLTDLLGYDGDSDKSIAMQFAERLLIRIAGIAGLVIFLWFVLDILAPLCLALIAASFATNIVFGALYIVSATVFLVCSVHVITVLLRIILLRTRLIFSRYSATS